MLFVTFIFGSPSISISSYRKRALCFSVCVCVCVCLCVYFLKSQFQYLAGGTATWANIRLGLYLSGKLISPVGQYMHNNAKRDKNFALSNTVDTSTLVNANCFDCIVDALLLRTIQSCTMKLDVIGVHTQQMRPNQNSSK